MLYLDNIITAATVFPFVAIALTIPVLIYHYRRFGALTFWRSLVIYSFIFYLLAAYCLIILPLPPKSVVAHLTTPRYNLVPFTFVREFINTTHWVWNQPATYLATLKQAATIQPLFNIVFNHPLWCLPSLLLPDIIQTDPIIKFWPHIILRINPAVRTLWYLPPTISVIRC